MATTSWTNKLTIYCHGTKSYKKVFYWLIFMLPEVAKVNSVHSRVGTLGDYLFNGFKHCSFIHLKEVVMRINKTVLGCFITSAVEIAGYLLYWKAGHALVDIPIGYKFMVLWMSHVCIDTRQFHRCCNWWCTCDRTIWSHRQDGFDELRL